jgi:uncharacterized Zn finger protein
VPRESARAKAHRYLTEGRVVIYEATPHHVRAHVRGSGEQHTVTATAWGWSCTCPNRTGNCSHLIAVQHITNRPQTRKRDNP